MDWFAAEQVVDDVYAITEPAFIDTATSYLFIGDEQDLLVDTGTGLHSITPVVEAFSNNPVMVVLTHAHFDHSGGHDAFDTIHAHPATLRLLEEPEPAGTAAYTLSPDQFNPVPTGLDDYAVPPVTAGQDLVAGDTITAGGRTFSVLHTPGHSRGSICLHDPEHGLLVPGDTLYKGELRWDLPTSDVAAYHTSLQQLQTLSPNLVLPGHNAPLDGTAFDRCVADAVQALEDV